MNVTLSKAATKVLGSVDKRTQQRLRQALERIPLGDVKPLNGKNPLFRLRVGAWRVVFFYVDIDAIVVARIASRGDVYKGGLLH